MSATTETAPPVARTQIDPRGPRFAATLTTLVLDASGREVSRASGAPTRDAVLATLAAAVAPASE